MSDEAQIRKRVLRTQMKARRGRMSARERAEASAAVTAVLLESPLWQGAERVGLFHSMTEEVSTAALLEAAWETGRDVALPVTPPLGNPLEFRRVLPETPLVPSSFGSMEPGSSASPVDPATLDLVVVSGLAFDERGARLGYGGGYYDRTLRHVGTAVMLAFAWQRATQVPEEAHDQRVRGVATEVGWFWAS